MRKLLFATADPRTLQSWEASLPAYKDVWDARIVSDTTGAHAQLTEDRDWDAIITPLSWQNGILLLGKARESSPEAVRIGVVPRSGLRAPQPSCVHQVVADPLDFRELEVALERSCHLRDLLRGERICQTVSELGELPSAPGIYLQLMQKLNGPEPSVGEIAGLIEGDVGTSARLLQLVNSAVFRTSHQIVTVRMTVSLLGLDVIKDVVLSMEAFQAFQKIPAIPGFSWEKLQAHCRLTAAIAAQMRLPAEIRDAAIVAALLHDIGKLVLACKMPDRFARLVARAQAEEKPLHQIEEELWGITHAEVGAYLLGLWGLPLRVTEAIAYHHSPSAVPHHRFDALAALYVANLLATEAEGVSNSAEWDLSFLEQAGVTGLLPGWKRMAREIASSQLEPVGVRAQ
jgi:putative nucleotidyltransferase with HDIG domain